MPTDPPAPPRPELLALLDAVKDHPDDDTPRLVLADWLDERDDPLDAARAASIRLGVAAGRDPQSPQPPYPDPRAVTERTSQWLGPLAEYASACALVRGLPHVALSGPTFLKPAFPPLLATEAFAFVQFVRLHDAGGPRMEAMAALPEFRFVPGLSVHPFNAPGAAASARFFASPNLSGLRQVAFRSVKPGAAGVQALARNPALGRLRKLALPHNKLVDKAVLALASGAHLCRLEVLDLSDNLLGDAGAAALAAAPALAGLRELNLRDNPRLTEGGKRLLRDRFGDRVKLTAALF